MKKLYFSLLVLFAVTISFAYTRSQSISGNSEKTAPSGKVAEVQETGLLVLQTEHPSYRLDGIKVTFSEPDCLLFEIRKPGHSVLVLKSKAPLMIAEYKGLIVRLRPGWDGTLGYSLYTLEIEAYASGSGQVRLTEQPVLAGLAQSQSELDARTSRFPENNEDLIKWQKVWRIKLANRLMNGGFPKRVPMEAEVIATEDHPSFTLRLVRYKTQSDHSNTLLISIPKNVSDAVPLLIALHGHEATWGEADTGAFTAGYPDDFCAYFAERGWAVVQPATMNHTLQHAGWTLQGEWTWDAMVALDYAISLPQVDARHVSVCGLSTGGHLAMNLLALDDRVNSGVVGCVLSSWHHYRERMRIPPHCDCGIFGQLGDLIEQCDWAALAAPKPVQFHHGRQDACYCPGADPALLNTEWNTSVMPEKEFGAIFAEVKKAYKLTGAPEKVKLFIHNEGHRVNNEAAYNFLTGEKVKLISKRVITFSPITGGVGFINEDGTNEHYLQLPEKKDMRWSGMGPVFPDKKHCIISSYDNYSITANVTGKLFTRLWKYNLSTGELTELITKGRPSNQIFCSGLLSDGEHMLCSVCTEDNTYQLLYLTDLDGSEWKLLSGKEEFIYGVQMNHNETRIAFHVASEGYAINTFDMEGKDRRRVAGEDGHLFFGPVWSPDDKWLAYLDCNNKTDPSHHYANLCIGNPEGNEHRVVTTGQSQYFGTAYGTRDHRGGGSNCTAWTPDGKYLIYTKLSVGAHHDAAYHAELGNHLENVFSPESARGGSSICLLNPFSVTEIPVTRYEEGKWDFRGAVSPDGEKMAYTSTKVAGRGEIFVCNINGNNNKFLTAGKDGFGADFPRWIEIVVEEGSLIAK